MNAFRDVCGQLKQVLLPETMTTAESPKLQSVWRPVLWPWKGQLMRTIFASSGKDKKCGPSKKMLLRGFGMQRLRTNAIGSCFLVVVVGAFKFSQNRRRKQAYLNFYKCYDPDSDFERMKKAGVFQCVTPDGEPGTID